MQCTAVCTVLVRFCLCVQPSANSVGAAANHTASTYQSYRRMVFDKSTLCGSAQALNNVPVACFHPNRPANPEHPQVMSRQHTLRFASCLVGRTIVALQLEGVHQCWQSSAERRCFNATQLPPKHEAAFTLVMARTGH